MIRSFRHKGLRDFFFDGSRKGIDPRLAPRIGRIFDILRAASEPTELRLPGYDLHPLTGDKAGYWAVKVSGNWRIIFAFDGEDAVDVDLVDYH